MLELKEFDTTTHYVIEIRCQALRHTWGLVDHYFMIIDDQEYHPGEYKLGNILPLGTTKGSHLVEIRTLCCKCYNKIVLNYVTNEDKRMANYYPLLNCETLSMGISIQSLAFLALPVIGILLFNGRLIEAIVVLLATIIFLLLASKYVFSRTRKQMCRHIVRVAEPLQK